MQDSQVKDPTGLGSVSNALKLLSLLGSQPSVRVVDVSREFEIGASTAHRLLSCLRDQGFLQQSDGSRRYIIGPELLRVARQVMGRYTLEHAARHHLEALCREVDETVNLHVLLGSETLCIETVPETRHSLHVKQIVGHRRSAHASAAGKLLLSALEPHEVRSLYTGGLSAITSHTIADIRSLEEELRTIRSQGFATNMDEGEEGIHAVSVEIRDRNKSPMAAISIAAPSVRMPMARARNLVTSLHTAAENITGTYFQGSDLEHK
jgi:DNA-binding IclR family transcriptional regulator